MAKDRIIATNLTLIIPGFPHRFRVVPLEVFREILMPLTAGGEVH